ncbi:MAG: DUF3526 domain-containing protein [Planctomycetaceae bacterium]|nr:DUF3526 domain-containing protein [Planctomycetaceae bacterium]
MLSIITRKELLEIRRDPATWGVLGVYVTILALSCVISQWVWTGQTSNQVARQRQAREEWLLQSTDSPHLATHDGTTIYKIPSPLTSVDPGTDPELGTVVRLESHRRHEATNTLQEDQLRLLRLDFTTPALLIQAVLPLLVILVSHVMASRERGQGTWELLASLGVTRRQAILGKLTAMFCLAATLSAPFLMSLIWIVSRPGADAGIMTPEFLCRAIAVYATSLLYLAGWSAAGIAASAHFRSGLSLMLLISCWAGWTLIVPRLAVDLASSQFPLPSHQRLQDAREIAIRQSSDGSDSLETFNAALEQQLLREYGVPQLSDLPVNLNAARLLAREDFTNSIDDRVESQLADVYRQQNRFLDWFEILSPYLAVRAVSTAFAGTDRHHHEAFIVSAEHYRRSLVKIMNTAEMKGERPGTTVDSRRQFWSQVPEFQQKLPPWTSLLHSRRWSIGLLVIWCLTMTSVAVLLPRGDIA